MYVPDVTVVRKKQSNLISLLLMEFEENGNDLIFCTWQCRVLALDIFMDLKKVACQIICYWKIGGLGRGMRTFVCWKTFAGWKIHHLQDHVQVLNSMWKERIGHLPPDTVEIHYMYSDLTFLIIENRTRNQILLRAWQGTDLSPAALTVNCVYVLYEIFDDNLFL